MAKPIPQMRRAQQVRQEITPKLPLAGCERQTFPFVLMVKPGTWEYVDSDGELGRLVPCVEEIRAVPGVDGTTAAPRGQAPDISATVLSHQRRGWIHLDPYDLRLDPTGDANTGESAYVATMDLQGGGRAYVPVWAIAIQRNDRVEWGVDIDIYSAFLAKVEQAVPPCTQAAANRIQAMLEERVERARNRAHRSDLAREEHQKHVATLARFERTWAAYMAAHEVETVRLRPSRRAVAVVQDPA